MDCWLPTIFQVSCLARDIHSNEAGAGYFLCTSARTRSVLFFYEYIDKLNVRALFCLLSVFTDLVNCSRSVLPWRTQSLENRDMSEWIAIAQWQECTKMARPDIVFEIRNAEGQTMLSPCVVPLPEMPFNWKSPAVMFRPVARPKPEHSTPLPPPKGSL